MKLELQNRYGLILLVLSCIMFSIFSFLSSAVADELAGVQIPYTLGVAKPYSLSFLEKWNINKGVKKILKDPSSLKLSEVKAAKHPSGVVLVCGMMNSKNGFGGYVGDQPFIGKLDEGVFLVYQIGDSDFYRSVVFGNCRAAKISFDADESYVSQNKKTEVDLQLDESNQMITEHGTLALIKTQLNGELIWNKKKIRDVGMYATFEQKFKTTQGDSIVLVSDSSGGTACPSEYFFVTIKSDGKFIVSKEFGTCSDNIDVSQSGNAISITMTGFKGPYETQADQTAALAEKHVFVLNDGAVKEKEKIK